MVFQVPLDIFLDIRGSLVHTLALSHNNLASNTSFESFEMYCESLDALPGGGHGLPAEFLRYLLLWLLLLVAHSRLRFSSTVSHLGLDTFLIHI